MKKMKTHRGFDYIDFRDYYGSQCSLQKSSIATQDCIWLGKKAEVKHLVYGKGWVDYPLPSGVEVMDRMHLTREQVKELLPYLKRFVKTGNF